MIRGKRGLIPAAVAKGSAPLLLSKPLVKTLGDVLNFKTNQLKLNKLGANLDLEENEAGKYILNLLDPTATPTADNPKRVALAPCSYSFCLTGTLY